MGLLLSSHVADCWLRGDTLPVGWALLIYHLHVTALLYYLTFLCLLQHPSATWRLQKPAVRAFAKAESQTGLFWPLNWFLGRVQTATVPPEGPRVARRMWWTAYKGWPSSFGGNHWSSNPRRKKKVHYRNPFEVSRFTTLSVPQFM
jgi:hypothetical protein